MKTTTVRFGPDLWRLLRSEAAQAEVPVSQYIRDAALARAVGAAAARGQGPFDLLASAVREAMPAERSASVRLEAERSLATLGRLIARERRGDAVALGAESKQARRRSEELAERVGRSARFAHARFHDETNIEYVARLWEAFRNQGAAGVAELVPDDVEWRPFQAGRKALLGTGEMLEFWGARTVVMPTPTMFHADGDDVLVCAELRLPDGSIKTLWSLYRFNGRRLTQAVSFEHESEARTYLRSGSPQRRGQPPDEMRDLLHSRGGGRT